VPGCPGWDVARLLDHISRVYASRTDIVEQGLTDRWPPRRVRPDKADPLEWFRAEATRLGAALAGADPAQPVQTFARERTVGFWIRRMAHETLIHRIDAEQAAGYESAVDPELAIDGISELFDVFITPQFDENEFEADEPVIGINSGGRSWVARFGRLTDKTHGKVEEMPMMVLDGQAKPSATVAGDPDRVLLWMWGRAPLAVVEVDGPLELAHRFREVCSI